MSFIVMTSLIAVTSLIVMVIDRRDVTDRYDEDRRSRCQKDDFKDGKTMEMPSYKLLRGSAIGRPLKRGGSHANESQWNGRWNFRPVDQ